MIKIDLHLHTVPCSLKDETFSFSVEILERYVKGRGLDVIAITNHNLFDKGNFELIKNHLSITVLPGIEVDLESGHILVITDKNDVDNFCQKCVDVNSIVNTKGKLSIDEFFSIFNDRGKYLFIPHYYKKPRIPNEIIEKFGHDIYCGEVDNQNKFIRLYKEKDGLVPVLFSDSRFDDPSKLSMRFTYLDTNLTDFKSIREILKDREKVFLNSKKAHTTFQILDDGTEASTGLNVILGKRSSGKTHTIDMIYSNFINNQKIKYIRQFELIEKNNNEKEEQLFNDRLGHRGSLFAEDYLKPFKDVVDSVQTINLEEENTRAGDYVDRLLEFASDADKHDIFAKIPIFSEQNFGVLNTDFISDLISAVSTLLDSGEYKNIVEKYISRDNLINLFRELVETYKKKAINVKAIENSNEIIDSLKQALTVESNQEPIPNFDIVNYAKNVYEITLFKKVTSLLNSEQIIKNQKVGRFVISAKRVKINTASDLQRVFKCKQSFSQLISKRDNSYEYLIAIKDSKLVPLDELYKAFVRIDFNVLNNDGFKVSGGERAEFNLEDKLFDARNYEMLLIDEPESSFDNIFLKDYIFKKIKSLSKVMPVFVSTHNNVVGASFKPNFILFTEKSVEDKNPIFRVFYGEPMDKNLVCCDGHITSNKIVQLDCLEGGEDIYIERKNTYENIKN